MRRLLCALLALTLALSLTVAADAAPKKRHVTKKGYGFLPGYRSPEQIEREELAIVRRRGPAYIYAYPQFYHGRWNGGGFGYCYVRTPIGPMWTCGK